MNIKNKLKYLFLYLLFLSIVWLLGFAYFLYKIPQACIAEINPDAVVILTGGKNRVEEGFKHFVESGAKTILISGVGEGVIKKDFDKLLDKYNISKDKLVLGRLARDTLGNAVETKIFVRLNNYNSLCLVTSGYHIPRSLFIFNTVMPDIKIYGCSVFSENFNHDSYLNSISSIWLAFREYNKLITTFALYKYNSLLETYDRNLINWFG